MTPSEVVVFVQAVARHYPGKITITRQTLDTWNTDLAGLTELEAQRAWAEHRSTCPHPVTAADLWNAHRRIAVTAAPAPPQPERQPAQLAYAAAHEAPDIAHAELAKARAILRGER